MDFVEAFFEKMETVDPNERDSIFRQIACSKAGVNGLGPDEIYDRLVDGFDMHAELKTINNQVNGILATMRMMLDGYSPKDGINGLSENLTFFQKFWVIGVAPLKSLQENMEAFKKKYIDSGIIDKGLK